MTLPSGWIDATIGDLAAYVSRGKSPKYVDVSSVPVVNQRAVRWSGVDTRHLKFVDPATADQWGPERTLREGDILWNSTGTGTIGRASLYSVLDGFERVVADSHVTVVRAAHEILPRYLFEFVRSPPVQSVIDKMQSGSTNQVELGRQAIVETKVPLPPAAEQRRIVAKLDALIARLARAKAELDRVPMLAEHLRQSAVVAAFRGELTAEWREQNHAAAISAPDLDAAFAERAGTKRKKPASDIDWQPSFNIPESWRWVSVDQILALAQYGTSAKTDENSAGVPVLRMGNLQGGELDWSSLKYLPSTHDEFPTLLLTSGDVLFNRTNSFELVGKSAVFRGALGPVSFASYLIRLRCSGILPDLLVRYLNSPIGREWVRSVASQQVGQANVNGTKLRSLAIPLPPFNEQAEMSRILEVVFARADHLDAEAVRARALLDRLESAILAKAFRGELVPQDPSDEPASVLLERIRTQRATSPNQRRGRRAASADV